MTDYVIIVQRQGASGEESVVCERRESEEVLAAIIRGTVDWESEDGSTGEADIKVSLRPQPYYVEVGNGEKCRCVARVSTDHETSKDIARVLRRKLGAESSRIIRVDMVTPAQSDRFEDELNEGMRPIEMWADIEHQAAPQPGLPDMIYTALRELSSRGQGAEGEVIP
jgi:hypothetical protein